MNIKRSHLVLLVLLGLIYVWALFNPYDMYMWRANMAVVTIYIVAFIYLYKRVGFSTVSVVLIFIHMVIMLIAAKYTYENFMPFNFLKDFFGLSRNNFDRVGHFMQGFAPVMGMRDMFLRGGYMKRTKFFNVTLVFFVIGISGLWEILEFVGSKVAGKEEAYFLSLQGDMWDAQWDMTLCTIAAVISLMLFTKLHDKQLIEDNIKVD